MATIIINNQYMRHPARNRVLKGGNNFSVFKKGINLNMFLEDCFKIITVHNWSQRFILPVPSLVRKSGEISE